jgi:hypothetical protein
MHFFLVDLEYIVQSVIKCLMFFENYVVLSFGLVCVLDQIYILLLDLFDHLDHLSRRFERDFPVADVLVISQEEGSLTF